MLEATLLARPELVKSVHADAPFLHVIPAMDGVITGGTFDGRAVVVNTADGRETIDEWKVADGTVVGWRDPEQRFYALQPGEHDGRRARPRRFRAHARGRRPDQSDPRIRLRQWQSGTSARALDQHRFWRACRRRGPRGRRCGRSCSVTRIHLDERERNTPRHREQRGALDRDRRRRRYGEAGRPRNRAVLLEADRRRTPPAPVVREFQCCRGCAADRCGDGPDSGQPLGGEGLRVAFSTDGSALAPATNMGTIQVFDPTGNTLVRDLHAEANPVGLVFTSDNQRLLAISQRGDIEVLDLTGRPKLSRPVAWENGLVAVFVGREAPRHTGASDSYVALVEVTSCASSALCAPPITS